MKPLEEREWFWLTLTTVKVLLGLIAISLLGLVLRGLWLNPLLIVGGAIGVYICYLIGNMIADLMGLNT